MNKACPYCQSESGYYQVQQVRREATYTWNSDFSGNRELSVFYKGKALRCMDCHEKVTSYVQGLIRENDNG